MPHSQTWNDAPRTLRRRLSTRAQAALGLAAIALVWGVITRQVFMGAGIDETFAGSEVPDIPVTLFTVASVAGRFTGLALEAAFYLAWWRSWGAPFRFGRFFAWIAGLSLIDAWALGLRTIARDHGGSIATWLAPVVGIDLWREGPAGSASSIGLAFATFGLTTIARIGLTAHAQARETGGRLWKPLLLTSVLWLACRVVTWWTLDLARGASPMP